MVSRFTNSLQPHLTKHRNFNSNKIFFHENEIKPKRSVNPPLVPIHQLPKYPIILSHGMGGDKAFLKYFTGIKTDLESLGCLVVQPIVWRYGSVYKRASLLNDQILALLKKYNTEKVNIIGHSMGGLDARHFISNLEGHKYVSSLTTISTPHWGSKHADWALNTIAEPLRVQSWIKYLPFETGAWDNLTVSYLKEVFNPNNPDHPNVSYYSIAGSVQFPLFHPLAFSGSIIFAHEGPNDGLVSVESSKWGNFLGTVPFDHAEQIGWSVWIDPRPLYRKLINYLVEQGH